MRKPHLRGRGPHFPILDMVQQYAFEPGYVVFTMPSPKRVRVKVGDLIEADTIHGLVMQESDHLPVYYFPMKDVHEEYLMASVTRTESPFKGTATHYSLNTGITLVEDAGWRYVDPVEGCPPIADYMAFYWNKMNHWYEEDEEIFVHARDPFRRVDCLPSSRHVQVIVDGEVVADSRRATFLFETGMPTRYYLPISDTRLDVLSPSPYISRCPYKCISNWNNVTVKGKSHDNMVWYYPDPVHESERIKGLVSFYNEFVDRILVDGIEQPKPVTASSHGYY
ncbi:MAG: hypothetical protein JWN43_3383 [Gammaproteobacteria bacterium]|nr:hypothetical protein [Gammaproteobacteria bacterium]